MTTFSDGDNLILDFGTSAVDGKVRIDSAMRHISIGDRKIDLPEGKQTTVVIGGNSVGQKPLHLLRVESGEKM